MSWRYRRRLSLTDRVMTLPYRGYALRIAADGELLSKVDDKLEELLRASPALWVAPPPPPPAPALDTSKETDSPSQDIETEQEEEIVKPKRRRRATTKRSK